MAQLLSFPEEIITQTYIFAGENTRALVRLSAVHRRLRAVWLQDSDYIIAQSLELKAPGHQDAIALTIIEACCPMPVSGFHRVNASKDDPSLRLHLPGLMRNIGLASAVCNGAIKWYNSTDQDELWNSPPLSYYYLTRGLVLAYHYPELRGPICDVLKRCLDDAIEDDDNIWTYLTKHAPEALRKGPSDPRCWAGSIQ